MTESSLQSPRSEEPAPLPPDERPLAIQMPVDIRSVALSLIAFAIVIVLLRYMQEVVIPFVLGGLLFYALDPIVDRLQKWRVPRALAAALVLLTAVGAVGSLAYSLRDEAIAVVEDLPSAAQKFRSALRSSRPHGPGALDKVQQAAQELEKTATDAVGDQQPPRGVMRVQVEEPMFRAGDYMWAGSLNLLSLLGQGVMIFFLTYFLLLSDDLFKAKTRGGNGPDLHEKETYGSASRRHC